MDGGWPRAYTTASGSKVVLYQPQIGLWPEQKHMTMGAAVSYQLKDAPKPVLGTLKIEVDTKVALDERLVHFDEFKITQANFPNIAKDQLAILVAELNDAIPREERVIGLDRVMAMMDTSAIVPRNVAGLKSDPPPIYYSDTPAVLVNIDGDPVWSPIQGSELKFVVNTNWDVFEYPPAKSYFLRVNESWLVADSVRGPWRAAGKLPEAFSQLPADDNWKEVRAALPGKPIAATARPTVYVSTVPAELIRVNGAPKYAPVTGTKLLWVSNTDSDVFRQGATGTIFYLVAGRWFSAPSVKGPWQFATPTLPEDFKKIPLDHPRSRVLASVPGTRPAIEAILLAQIPQTARVNRKELKAPDVAYAGEPQFEPIPQTTVARAVNTDMDIIKVGDLYYMCAEGVWFKASSANGPWEVADSVPAAIYEIPISSPAHDVTYVTIEDSDDEWVEFAAAAAYTGMMVGWGSVMWGSGWYYPPYIYGGGVLRALPELWIRRRVQPVDRRLHARRRRVWSVRRRRVCVALQPADGHLLARRGGLRPRRRARSGVGLESANRNGRGHAPGIERLRQLGLDRGPARRSVGVHLARDEPCDRDDDTWNAGQRWRRSPHTQSGRCRRCRRRRANRKRRRVCRPRRQRVPQSGRQLAEVRQRQLELGRPRGAAPDRDLGPARIGVSRADGFGHPRRSQSRSSWAVRGPAAHQRFGLVPQQRRITLERGQLSRRRHVTAAAACAAVGVDRPRRQRVPR